MTPGLLYPWRRKEMNMKMAEKWEQRGRREGGDGWGERRERKEGDCRGSYGEKWAIEGERIKADVWGLGDGGVGGGISYGRCSRETRGIEVGLSKVVLCICQFSSVVLYDSLAPGASSSRGQRIIRRVSSREGIDVWANKLSVLVMKHLQHEASLLC